MGGWGPEHHGCMREAVFRRRRVILRAQSDFPLRKSMPAAVWGIKKRGQGAGGRQGDPRSLAERWR